MTGRLGVAAARMIGFLALAGAVLGGCSQRRIAVTSEPPGAIVWINDVEVGRTPLETAFTFYGEYDVRLRLDGYEPINTSREAEQPWYDTMPLDLVTAALPTGVKTVVRWHFSLTPKPSVDEAVAEQAKLLDRARGLRERLESGE